MKWEAILFFISCSELNSTWLITSELANQRARKALFTCVVYTNFPCSKFWLRIWVNYCRKLHEYKSQSFLLFFMRIVVLIVIIISTRVVFLRKWRHILFSVWYIFSIETETHLRKRRNEVIQICASRPLQHYLNALYQSKSWCHLSCENENANRTRFHINGCSTASFW